MTDIDEQEAQIRRTMADGVFLAVDQRMLLRYLDATRVALSGARADLALAQTEIANLRAIYASVAGRDPFEATERELAEQDAAGADAMTIAEKLVSDYTRSGGPLSGSLIQTHIAHEIEAAEARGEAKERDLRMELVRDELRALRDERDAEFERGAQQMRERVEEIIEAVIEEQYDEAGNVLSIDGLDLVRSVARRIGALKEPT